MDHQGIIVGPSRITTTVVRASRGCNANSKNFLRVKTFGLVTSLRLYPTRRARLSLRSGRTMPRYSSAVALYYRLSSRLRVRLILKLAARASYKRSHQRAGRTVRLHWKSIQENPSARHWHVSCPLNGKWAARRPPALEWRDVRGITTIVA
jgi:hypothetical protein